MVGFNGIHDTAAVMDLREVLLGQVLQKMGFQIRFIAAVVTDRILKSFVVAEGKGIHCIVNQLSHGVVVQKLQLLPALQPIADPVHISLRVAPVMPVQQTAAKGAFEIGGRIFIRLDTAGDKGEGIPPRCVNKMLRYQVLSQHAMTVGCNNAHSLSFTR